MNLKTISILLFFIVLLESGWIYKTIQVQKEQSVRGAMEEQSKFGTENKQSPSVTEKSAGQANAPTTAAIANTDQEIMKLKDALEVSLEHQVVIDSLELVPGTSHIFKAQTSVQRFYVDNREGLIIMGHLIDPKTKMNLTTNNEVVVIKGFLHPSKEMGLRMASPEQRGMIMNQLNKDAQSGAAKGAK